MLCNLCMSSLVSSYAVFENYTLMKCQSCGLLFTDHQSVKQSSLYSKDYFSGVHANFFADCTIGYEEKIAMSGKLQNFHTVLKKIKHIKPEGTFLDVGSATGIFLDMAQKEGYAVVGVDVSEYACTYAREHFGIDARCGKLEDLRLKEKQFDVITMWDLLEHVPDPRAFLHEVRRLLKDDGVMFILTVNDSSLMGWLADGIYIGSFKMIPYFTRLIHPIHHNYHFKEKHLLRYLEEAGFSVVWKQKSEMPIQNIEAGSAVKTLARILYFFSETLHLQHEIRLLANKKS